MSKGLDRSQTRRALASDYLAALERDLARLPLVVYNHTVDPDEKSRAMDLFERMLLLGSQAAKQALSDWDRR